MNAQMDAVVAAIEADKSGIPAALNAAFGSAVPETKTRLAYALATFILKQVVLRKVGTAAFGEGSPRLTNGRGGALSRNNVAAGERLFHGKARCSACHVGANFSDELLHDTGVAVTARAFKTPTLWDLEATAPYFHDGSKKTLREVIDFYDKGGRTTREIDPEMRPLGLTEVQKAQLEEFLLTMASGPRVATKAPGARGNWSDAAVWRGGVIPSDLNSAVAQSRSILTFDSAAPDTVGGIDGNALSLTLEKNLTVKGDLNMREGTLVMNDHSVTVSGVLSNLERGVSNGNGMVLRRGSGRVSAGFVYLSRASGDVTLLSGDEIRGGYRCSVSGAFDIAPKLVIQQRAGDTSGVTITDTGSYIEMETGTKPRQKCQIELKWDTPRRGWILRWAGERTAELNALKNNGQLLTNGNVSITHDAATGFTTVSAQ